jgi:hypothetical protein
MKVVRFHLPGGLQQTVVEIGPGFEDSDFSPWETDI